MRGSIPPLPNTSSWRGAKLKHRDIFTISVTFSCKGKGKVVPLLDQEPRHEDVSVV
jgi:hypothetical protein